MRMSAPSHVTECGLPGITTVPYGVHLCHFYDSRQDLVQALVPYFEAGLRSNERCIWVTAAPLEAAEARAELAKVLPGVDEAMRQGRLRILDFSDWYAESEKLKGLEVVNLWLREEEAALAAGYSGLRITGNTSFLTPEDWDGFMEYERAINQAFLQRRIVTLCSYRLQQAGPAELLDVVRSHHCTVEHTETSWRVLTSSETEIRG
jgi:hypothetical protein